MTTHDRNPIATLLGVEPVRDRLDLSFEGRDVSLHPATPSTCESPVTRWADGSRDVAALPGSGDLAHRVADLLAHAFRRGLGRHEAGDVLDRVRSSLGDLQELGASSGP